MEEKEHSELKRRQGTRHSNIKSVYSYLQMTGEGGGDQQDDFFEDYNEAVYQPNEHLVV